MKKGKTTPSLPSGLVTFIFTDIVGSTELKGKMRGETASDRAESFFKLIKEPHDIVIANRVAKRGGVIVKGTGDGFLIAFADAEKAVLCAVEIQEDLKGGTIRTPLGQLQVRIGLNSGQATPRNGDYTASAVDKAARVESCALPGTVYLSHEAHGLVREKVRDISTESVGKHAMKGLGREELFMANRTGQPRANPRIHSKSSTKPSVSVLPVLGWAQPERNSVLVPQLDLVVIGERDEDRFKWFEKLLRDVYEVSALQARTFDEVRRFGEDQTVSTLNTIVFLSDDLPFSSSKSNPDPNLNFVRLEQIARFADSAFVCIVTKESDPLLGSVDRQPHHVHLQSWPPTEKDRQRVLNELGSLGSRLSRLMDLSEIAENTEWEKDNRTFDLQIRSLDESHDLAAGRETLLRVIRKCLDCHDTTNIEIKRLEHGEPGSLVFQVAITIGDKNEKFLLRLNNLLWKLRNEVRGHLEAQHLPDYHEHIAAIRKPISSIKSLDPNDQLKDQFIVNSGRWYAIHCDFLGGRPLGKFINLETALTAKPVALQKKTRDTLSGYSLTSTEPDRVLAHRVKLFSATLDGLSEMWYGRKGTGSRQCRPIWQTEDAADDQFIPLPPYQLTRRVKGLVQEFLDCRESAIGPRLFPNWTHHMELVLKLVSDSATDFGWTSDSIPFTLSPVHGDLNSKNVLLYLQRDKYPVVIDLASFQKDGHALQDFARLEVELKLVLLDRQEESPLAAYDYSDSQIPLWLEMERKLLQSPALDKSKLISFRAKQTNWTKGTYRQNVDLIHRLVMLLRKRACEVQQGSFDTHEPVAFADEYLPALLYHTVRAIGYPSLSVFKKLLAVHTAGEILKRLDSEWSEPSNCVDLPST